MTLLLSNEDVDKALTHEDALSATEAILGELAQGQAINRPRSQTYMPASAVASGHCASPPTWPASLIRTA
jgi:hypothetical protein